MEKSPPLYYVRKSWVESGTQIGAYPTLEQAVTAAKLNNKYCVYDEDGFKVYPERTYTRISLYKIAPTSFYKGPGTHYPEVMKINGYKEVILLDEYNNWGLTEFGWIKLDDWRKKDD